MTKFTDEETERGLRALVLNQGNTARTQKALELVGIEISERSLRDWRDSVRFTELSKDRAWVEDELAQLSELAAAIQAQVEIRYALASLADTDEQVQSMRPGQRASAMHNVGKAKGVNIDKAGELRGRPQRPSGDVRTLEEIKRLLSTRFGNVIQFNPALLPDAESTAQEIPVRSSESPPKPKKHER